MAELEILAASRLQSADGCSRLGYLARFGLEFYLACQAPAARR